MKIAEISPAFEKLDNTSKDNYRPISTLSNFTKPFEGILFTQLNRYMQNKFSKYLMGFRKYHNTQNSLLRMIESWNVRLSNGSKVGVIIFLSLQKCDLANYADDSTLYTSDKSISNIMNSLSHDFTILSKWFYNNFIVLNPDKCSFMLLGVDDELQTNLVCGN